MCEIDLDSASRCAPHIMQVVGKSHSLEGISATD
jgi:hypothetical protein